MPGIFGYVKELNTEAGEKFLQKMANALEPETRFAREGYAEDGFGFGRASLKILSPEVQPVWDVHHEVALVLEGEVYEKAHLREMLDRVNGRSNPRTDAELLLSLYLHFGEGFLQSLNGAFVLAIWEKPTRTLKIANDRQGLYPLYYTRHSGGLVFGSGVRALLADPQVSRSIDKVAIQEYLTFDHVLGQRTLLEQVKLLPQASLLTFSEGNLEVRFYYRLNYMTEHPIRNERDYYDQLVFETRRAVHRQSQDDLTAGLMLSGGLDSRMLLAVLAEQNKQAFNTFTWSIPGSSDARFAREAAQKAKVPHHFFELKPDWLLENGEKAVRITDGMGNIVNLHAIAALEQESQYAQVIYKGFLGDAMFGFGLRPRFWSLYDQETAFEVHLEAYRDYNVLTFDLPQHEWIFSPSFLQETGDGLMQDFKAGILACNSPELSDQRCYFDLTNRVPRMTLNGVLVARDRTVVRLPYADNDLVEFSAQVPPFLRFERRIMDDAFVSTFPTLARVPLARTGLPMVNCAREVWLRNVQFAQWHLRHAGLGKLAGPESRPYKDYNTWFRTVLREWTEQTLLNPRALERGYFKPETVRQIVRDHMQGKNQSVRIGVLMSIELWHKMYID